MTFTSRSSVCGPYWLALACVVCKIVETFDIRKCQCWTDIFHLRSRGRSTVSVFTPVPCRASRRFDSLICSYHFHVTSMLEALYPLLALITSYCSRWTGWSSCVRSSGWGHPGCCSVAGFLLCFVQAFFANCYHLFCQFVLCTFSWRFPWPFAISLLFRVSLPLSFQFPFSSHGRLKGCLVCPSRITGV